MGYPKFHGQDVDLAEMLAGAEDLDAVRQAYIRERVIRGQMAMHDESREIVVEMIDAAAAMDEEAVLELTDGQPTTLADALRRYITGLETQIGEARDPEIHAVIEELDVLAAYPWPVKS